MKAAFEGYGKGISAVLNLKLAAFFYDVTPYCEKRGTGMGPGKAISVDCSNVPGGEIVEAVLKDLALGNKTARAVKGLLLNLKRWLDVPLEVCASPVVAALVFRLLAEETSLDPPVFIAFAAVAAGAEDEVSRAPRIKALKAMMEYYVTTFRDTPPEPLCNGVEIMSKFKIPPGKEVGKLKNKLEKAILRGEVRDEKGAFLYIKKKIYERWG